MFPTWLLLNSLQRFGAERPRTRVQLLETVLGGTDEALYDPSSAAPDPLLILVS